MLVSFTALVPWTLFSASLTDMVGSMVDNMSLVTKIYFPREILPVAVLLARLMDFGIAAAVIVVLMVYYNPPFFPLGWLSLPFIVAVQLLLMLGLGLIGAALNVFYRDVKHLVALGLQRSGCTHHRSFTRRRWFRSAGARFTSSIQWPGLLRLIALYCSTGSCQMHPWLRLR